MQPDDDFERTPPHDLEAERSVLGGMLLSAAAEDVLALLSGGDFYRPAHATIFDTIRAQVAAGEPADAVTVAAALAEAGVLGKIGGGPYLHELTEAVPTAANAAYYARIVKDRSVRREFIALGARIAQFGYRTGEDVADLVNAAQAAVLDLGAEGHRSSAVTFTEILDETLAQILDDERPGRGASTGLGILDDVIGGLKPGQLIVVAGRPGMGKTILATDFMRAVSIRAAEPSLMFTLEMSRTDIQKRLLAAEAEANLKRIVNGGLRGDERARLATAADRLRGVFITIDDTADVDLAHIRSTARRVVADTGLSLIVVDYLQLMATGGNGTNRAVELGAVSRGLKVLARELEVPIVACAQLNRSSETRTDRRPQLSDLRESGAFEQDSDVVILLHRPDYAEPEHPRAGEVDFIVAKNRNGPIETVSAVAQLHWSRFVDPSI